MWHFVGHSSGKAASYALARGGDFVDVYWWIYIDIAATFWSFALFVAQLLLLLGGWRRLLLVALVQKRIFNT